MRNGRPTGAGKRTRARDEFKWFPPNSWSGTSFDNTVQTIPQHPGQAGRTSDDPGLRKKPRNEAQGGGESGEAGLGRQKVVELFLLQVHPTRDANAPLFSLARSANRGAAAAIVGSRDGSARRAFRRDKGVVQHFPETRLPPALLAHSDQLTSSLPSPSESTPNPQEPGRPPAIPSHP